jgi:hypothetical protein
MNMNSTRCDKDTCQHKPTGTVEVLRDVDFGLGSVVKAGKYPVHHESPWGPVLYERNDLGHMLQVNKRDVRRLTREEGPHPW